MNTNDKSPYPSLLAYLYASYDIHIFSNLCLVGTVRGWIGFGIFDFDNPPKVVRGCLQSNEDGATSEGL